MNDFFVETSAPSNIALIKYMGKLDAINGTSTNTPTNSSLSWTLNELKTYIRIQKLDDLKQDTDPKDIWRPLQRDGLPLLSLSEKSKARFLDHFKFLKEKFQINDNFIIESANNFPSDCGLASSASSFAALTKASIEMFQKLSPNSFELSVNNLAELSRLGSGSSCRSFFEPWALWDSRGAREIELPFKNLQHQVIICDGEKKEVSSSQAHKRVLTSYLFAGRTERAQKRLSDLIEAFRKLNWQGAYEICWAEFWDMHALFETSKPSFSYMNASSFSVLSYVRNIWKTFDDGPIVTMDAGPNVHLLWRQDQIKLYEQVAQEFLKSHLVISNTRRQL